MRIQSALIKLANEEPLGGVIRRCRNWLHLVLALVSSQGSLPLGMGLTAVQRMGTVAREEPQD